MSCDLLSAFNRDFSSYYSGLVGTNSVLNSLSYSVWLVYSSTSVPRYLVRLSPSFNCNRSLLLSVAYLFKHNRLPGFACIDLSLSNPLFVQSAPSSLFLTYLSISP